MPPAGCVVKFRSARFAPCSEYRNDLATCTRTDPPAAGITDMRKGMSGLTALIVACLNKEPLSDVVFVFRGRRGY